ncbi:hypothetical protein DH2020_000678 [Rehmannia glutinosa]|uniref:Cation/H+ exchanger domain-containing protein n=1 Tax=Rehmannia glutinosa TaxID=99300 RepID=A0ABR0XXT0_REHGL
MYFLFLSGVKIDINVIKRAEKKHWYIALMGVLAPLCCSISIALIERKSLDKEIAKASSIWGISSYLATSAFPVLYPIVRELNLLSSGIGRMALSTAVVSDAIGMNALIIFEASRQGEQKTITALWFVMSTVFVVVTMIGVMVAGLISDMFGLTIVNGPLWLGLAVPDGPPLGTILVEKSEIIVRNFLLSFSFMYIGLVIDVSSVSGQWSHLQPLLVMVLASNMVKMVSTLVASRFFDMVIRDNNRKPHFTVMVLSVVSVTALATPLISILYDPTRPYMVTKRRNIQHTPHNTELHIVACIHGEDNLSGLMKLLEISNPTVNCPLSVHALCLVELVGRSNPVLIDHDIEEKRSDEANFSSIHNALKIFQESRGESMKIHSYTTITSKKSMYQDICELALSKKACLIILPTKQSLDNINVTRTTKQVFQTVNSNVLAHAPCSVGILVDKTPHQNLVNGVLRSSMHHLAVLFLGGADCREALAYADRMAESPDISLTVIRFLSHENEGDNEIEKKLGDGLVTWFWVKSEGNNRIVYREVVVKNGKKRLLRFRHGINPVLLKGLSNWSENNELGVIGDYVVSVDFDSKASVLAIQQQILRGQEKAPARPSPVETIAALLVQGTEPF